MTNIDLNSDRGIIPTQNVVVEYDNLPFRCREGASWKYKIKDCKEGSRQPPRGNHTLTIHSSMRKAHA